MWLERPVEHLGYVAVPPTVHTRDAGNLGARSQAVTGRTVDLVLRLDHARARAADPGRWPGLPGPWSHPLSVDGQLVAMPLPAHGPAADLAPGHPHDPGRVRRVRPSTLREPRRRRRDVPRPMTTSLATPRLRPRAARTHDRVARSPRSGAACSPPDQRSSHGPPIRRPRSLCSSPPCSPSVS